MQVLWRWREASGCTARWSKNTMSNVANIHGALPLSNETVKVVRELDKTITDAINKARQAGLPQGLVVGILHGYALGETARMVNAAD